MITQHACRRYVLSSAGNTRIKHCVREMTTARRPTLPVIKPLAIARSCLTQNEIWQLPS